MEKIESKNGHLTITNEKENISLEDCPFETLKKRLAHYKKEEEETSFPFTGGAAGYFGYDLARGIEKLPACAQAHPDVPDMCIGIYDRLFSFDHKNNTAHFLVYAENKEEAKKRFLQISEEQIPPSPKKNTPLQWAPEGSDEEYKNKIRNIIDYIYAGEVFQANLSRRWEASLPETFDPFAHYLHLRKTNPAPFAAYMNFGSLKIASTSPERFLSVKGRNVETRPIKGTLPSSKNPNLLLGSEKNRAENMMIVDLMRNDLSKVCENRSVCVPQLCGLETFEGVHHLVSIVKGTLRKKYGPVDLLKACFPGGSITGAPKVRAMEIIETLEPYRRGPYCGALGYIGFNGQMDTSITIRTLVYSGDTVTLQSGGGIVYDSNPEEELQETCDKAQKIFESFEPPEKKEDAA